MNDKEIMSNYLSLLKSDVEVYIHGTIEAANKDSKDNLKYALDQTLLSLERTFNLMSDNNMYKVENTSCSNINKVFKKINENF